MEQMEQMMMQIWLGGLLARLKDGEVEHVIKELEIALARIEEDQDDPGGTEKSTGVLSDKSRSDGVVGGEGGRSDLGESIDEGQTKTRSESDTGRVHEGDADSATDEGGDHSREHEESGEGTEGISQGSNGGQSNREPPRQDEQS